MITLSLANLQHSLLILVGLCLLMLICHIISNNAEAKKILEANAARKAEIDSLRIANHRTLNSSKGKAVLSIFQSLNIECISNRQLSCPHAILLPIGNDKYSKEIDLLVVSEIGVFVFEVKDWRGLWAAKGDQPHLLSKVSSKSSSSSSSNSSHLSSQHPSNDRPAPLLKTQNKLKDLLNRANLTDIHAQALVVFTDNQGNVDAQLPPNYLHISELTYYFRQQAASFFDAIEYEGEGGYDVYDLAEQIRPCLDSSTNALHNHMMRLSPSSES